MNRQELEKKKIQLIRRINKTSNMQLLEKIEEFLDNNEEEYEEESVNEEYNEVGGNTKVWKTGSVQLKDAKRFLNELHNKTGRQF